MSIAENQFCLGHEDHCVQLCNSANVQKEIEVLFTCKGFTTGSLFLGNSHDWI